MTEPTAYFNENDPFAAAWLRELIKAGHIAKGEVDERSIEDVRPSDLLGFTQCHFFAGIGVWSHSLRCAGWPDSRPVWTGSCPCQPFSAAGKRGGTSDERHLWPAFFHLICGAEPAHIFGEQVASKDGLAWFDTVQSDLQAADYTVGAADLCAAGFGAPHIRQRLYFVADSQRDGRREERPDSGRLTEGNRTEADSDADFCVCDYRPRRKCSVHPGVLAHPNGRNSSPEGLQRSGQHGQFEEDGGSVRSLVNAASEQMGLPGCSRQPRGASELANSDESGRKGFGGNGEERATEHSSLVNGDWSGADWIYCRDEKYRPVEAGTFPLAHGIANRVGKLRGYGNALVAPVATAFIESYLEVERESA